MQIAAHFLSGWCLGNCFNLKPSERFGCVLAATLADLDGMGYFFSERLYYTLHHVLGHNLLIGAVLALVLTLRLSRHWPCFVLFFCAFHLHLLMDLFGSGGGWGMTYFWPFSDTEYSSIYAWSFTGWQNWSTFIGLIIWSILIFKWTGRTPFEYAAPRVHRAFHSVFGKFFSRTSQSSC